MFCEYYQAVVSVPYTWFITGIFRSEDNLVFERTLEQEKQILEFFVPIENESKFLDIMQYLRENGYVISFEKLKNRFQCLV